MRTLVTTQLASLLTRLRGRLRQAMAVEVALSAQRVFRGAGPIGLGTAKLRPVSRSHAIFLRAGFGFALTTQIYDLSHGGPQQTSGARTSARLDIIASCRAWRQALTSTSKTVAIGIGRRRPP